MHSVPWQLLKLGGLPWRCLGALLSKALRLGLRVVWEDDEKLIIQAQSQLEQQWCSCCAWDGWMDRMKDLSKARPMGKVILVFTPGVLL